ncbi:MAG TPA: PPC domain-containing protein, partial [Candidatus Obscuribacterales bacterium]
MTDVFAPAIEQDWLNLEVSHGAKELAPTHYGLPDLTHRFASSPSLLSLRDAIAALGPLADPSPHDLRGYDLSPATVLIDDTQLKDDTNADTILGRSTQQNLVGSLSDRILLSPNRAATVINRQGEAGTDDALSTALSTGLYSGLSELTINGTIGGTNHLAPDLDVDFYSVSLQAGDRLLIDIDAELLGTSLDSGLRLFDAAGNEIAWSDDDQAPGEEFTFDSYLDFTADTTGTYYIGVSGYPNFDYSPLTPYSGSSSSRGDYQLNLTLMPYAREQNDLITQGILTGLSSSNPGQVQFTGVIGDSPNVIPTFDRDFFHVRLDAGDVLTVDIDAFAQGTWLDSVVRVFDASGNEVAFSDDAAAPGETLSYDPYLQFTAGQTGNYYIGISGYGNALYDPFDPFSGASGSTGEYTLTIDVAHDLSSDESNDTLTEAIYTGLSSATPGTIEVQGVIGDNPSLAPGLDVDMFSVQLNAGDRLMIDVDAHQFGGSLDSGLRIFDALGNELLLSDDNPAPDEPFSFDPYLEFTATEAGNYYIGLSGYWNYDYNPFIVGSGTPGSTGDYTMALTVESGASIPVNPGFSSIYGYGLVDAAVAVAASIGEPTFPDQPNLGGNLWGV